MDNFLGMEKNCYIIHVKLQFETHLETKVGDFNAFMAQEASFTLASTIYHYNEEKLRIP